MKKRFLTPTIEYIFFEEEDIMVTSAVYAQRTNSTTDTTVELKMSDIIFLQEN